MSARPTLWFDVSYTRTQRGSIGITRTVRRLHESLSRACASGAGRCEPVAFSWRGYCRADMGGASTQVPTGAGSRRVHWMVSPWLRMLVSAAVRAVPWVLLGPAWRWLSAAAFHRLAGPNASLAPIEKGDLLLIADASWKYPAWRGARQARQRGAKVILVVYDLMPIRFPQFCFSLIPPVYVDWLKNMQSNCDAILCISEATRADLERWRSEIGGPRAGWAPLGAFRLGSDAVTQLARTPPRADLLHFIKGDAPCFGAVGTIEPKKNYGLLLEAFEQLWNEGLAFRLVIAGRPTPECSQLLHTLSTHPQLGHKLLVLHDASDGEVCAIYDACKALLLPSRFEGFGLPLVEARTRGCRVIASSIASFVELADAGVTLFEENSVQALRQAVVDVAAMDAQVPSMPAFTWDDSAEALLAGIQRLTSPPDH